MHQLPTHVMPVHAVQWFPELPATVHVDSWGVEYRVWSACEVKELTEGQMYDQGGRFTQPVPTRTVLMGKSWNDVVAPGDWIVTRRDGRQSIVKPDVFAAIYEEATDADA